MLFSLIQTVLNGFAAFLDVVVGLLPQSPFTTDLYTVGAKYLGIINYFIPIGAMVDLMGVWLVCVTGFYIYMALGRWVKLLD